MDLSNTINITVVDHDDKEHIISCPTDMDLNLMEICKASDLPVAGTCGGMALCSSCHVYILSDHDVLERPDAEEDMLDQAFFVLDNSRLGCQMKIEKNLDNLKVKLAPQAD